MKPIRALRPRPISPFSVEGPSAPSVADNEIVQTMLYDKALELFDSSGDRFEAVKYLEGKCRDLQERYPANASMFSSIYRYALKKYMTELILSDVTLPQLEKYPPEGADEIDKDCTVKHNILLAQPPPTFAVDNLIVELKL